MRVRLKLDRLLDLVAKSQLSQNHWAIKLGISRGHWSAILNGRYPFPSPKTRARLVEVFGVAFDDLFYVDSGPDGDADATFQAALADRYLIDREIGHGGMGTVYLARDVKHNRTVALKVVSPEAVGGIGIPQFLKETRYTARLQHQNILPVYDSGEAGGSPYYVTPYIEGGSLRSRLAERGSLPLSETVHISDQVAQALAYAHERQILHCDIKPENVLVAGSGRHLHVWVADFGISRVIHAETAEWARKGELDSSAGTPAYVSPEQASGENTLTPASDVYSLACMLYECLTGTPPFRGTTTMEVVSRRFVSTVPDVRRLAPDVPRPAAEALRAAMEIDPGARTGTPVALVERLMEARRRSRPSVADRFGATATRGLTWLARTLRPKPSLRRQTFMDRLWQDLGYAMRSLLRRPLFAAVVLGTLALGIGMNTAIFSVLYGVLYRPLGYAEPEELVRIGRTRPELPDVLLPISPGNFWELAPQITTLTRFEAEVGSSVVLTERGDPTRLTGARATPGFFDLLGVPPAMGRTFNEGDGTPGTEPVVLLSHQFWQTRLGADPAVVGTSLRLNDEPRTVIGVMGPDFEFSNEELWVPFVWTDSMKTFRGSNYLRLYGRLAPGQSIGQSIAELHELWTRQGAQYGDDFDDSGMSMIPLRDAFVERSRTALLVLGGAVLFVLLIACANVANLLLARSEVRQREIAVRAALGAGRGRLVRQFLTESILIAFIGGTMGVILAVIGVRAILAAYGNAIPRAEDIGINQSVLAYSLIVSLGTGILIGLVPALQIRPDHSALKEGARGGSSRLTLFRQGLVSAEIALALMLLTGAGLLIKSFWNAMQADLGFEHENLVAANFWFPPSRYQNEVDTEEFVVNLEAQLEANPAVASVTMANMVPIRNFGNNFTQIGVVGDEERTASFVEYRAVTPDFFEGMGIPIIRGQNFTLTDARDERRVIVIDRELARQLFGAELDPIGQRLSIGPQQPEILGVVGDVRSFGPDERPRPTVYFPQTYESNVLVRTTRAVEELTPIIRDVSASIDPNVALVRVDPMDDIITRSLGDRRFQLSLIGIFAAVALILGAVGVFGVMSYTVERQTREIGVRMAMGARASDVLRLILWRTGRLALIGVGIGILGAVAVRQALTSLVFEVNTLDPVIYGGVAAGLLAIALLAGFVPAHRAAAVEPTEALRYE